MKDNKWEVGGGSSWTTKISLEGGECDREAASMHYGRALREIIDWVEVNAKFDLVKAGKI